MSGYAAIATVALTVSIGSATAVGFVYKNAVYTENAGKSEVQTLVQPPVQSFVVVGASKGDVGSFANSWATEDAPGCKGVGNSWSCAGNANASNDHFSILGSPAATDWRGDVQDVYYALNRYDQIGWSWEIPEPGLVQISTTRHAQSAGEALQAAQSGAATQGGAGNQSQVGAQFAAADSFPAGQVKGAPGQLIEIQVAPSLLTDADLALLSALTDLSAPADMLGSADILSTPMNLSAPTGLPSAPTDFTSLSPVTDLLIPYAEDAVPGPSAAAPEPATWVMMLAGFAGLVLAAFRVPRKRRLEET